MANLTTNADIKSDALFRAGELTDGTSDFDAQALVYLNRSYRELYMGGQSFLPAVNEMWWWMKDEANLILDANITTGDVSVTNNSNQVIFSAIPVPTSAPDVTNWFLKIDSMPDFYQIGSIADFTATLDSVYTGDTAGAESYMLFQRDHDLSASAIKIIGHMSAYQEGEYTIDGMALSEMDVKFPMALIRSGVPTKFAQVDEDTIRFNRSGPSTEGDILRVDYDFMIRPVDLVDDSTEPLVPTQYRHILSDMTLFYLLADKDDLKQENTGLQARQGINSMAQENRARWTQTGIPGQIIYRQRDVNRRILRTAQQGVIIA